MTERDLTLPSVKRTYRLQIMLNAEEIAILDAWRFEKRLPTRSDAVRELLRQGLAAKGYDVDRGARSVDFGVLKPPYRMSLGKVIVRALKH